MIKKHSDDPDVEEAAKQASDIISETLSALPQAQTYDYGGNELRIGEYDVCAICTASIAEAQQANVALLKKAETLDNPVIKEHLELAAQLFKLEADAAIIRAEFHNGHGTEKILNSLLGYQFTRSIHDAYDHSHHKEQANE